MKIRIAFELDVHDNVSVLAMQKAAFDAAWEAAATVEGETQETASVDRVRVSFPATARQP